jgi:RNA 3'-terminal phosphate cyclase (ATP)
MIQIDGAAKSGSGTILRYGVVLAALTGRAVGIRNVRARRPKPGLRPQHLAAVRAVAEMTGGTLEGDDVGSQEVRFSPGGRIRGGDYAWEIPTAGSTLLLALTVLPVAAFADAACRFRLTGGVFQDFAPSCFHTQYCLLPLLARHGLPTEIELVQPGYVPKGRGIIEIAVEPLSSGSSLFPLILDRRDESLSLWGIAFSSHLERQGVSDRLAAACREELGRRRLEADLRIVYDHIAPQPGAVLFLAAEDGSGVVLGSDMAGAPGRRSEEIGRKVADNLRRDLRTGAAVDRFLADQLILYAALAGGTSRYRIPGVTDHVESNCWLVESLLGARVALEDRLLTVEGIGLKRT